MDLLQKLVKNLAAPEVGKKLREGSRIMWGATFKGICSSFDIAWNCRESL